MKLLKILMIALFCISSKANAQQNVIKHKPKITIKKQSDGTAWFVCHYYIDSADNQSSTGLYLYSPKVHDSVDIVKCQESIPDTAALVAYINGIFLYGKKTTE